MPLSTYLLAMFYKLIMVRNKNGCDSCMTETVHIIEITLCSQQIVNDEFQPVRAFRNFQTLNFVTIPVRVRENGKL